MGTRRKTDAAGKRLEKIYDLSDRILDRLGEAVDTLEPTDTQKLRHVVASVKEIKDIQDLRTPEEQSEQELKLRALRSSVTSAEEDSPSPSEIIVKIGDNFSE